MNRDTEQQLSPSQLANIRLSMEPSQFVLFDRAQLRKTVIALLDHVALTESNDSRDTGDKPSESRVTATDTASERRETDPESNDSRPEDVGTTEDAWGNEVDEPRQHGFGERDTDFPDSRNAKTPEDGLASQSVIANSPHEDGFEEQP